MRPTASLFARIRGDGSTYSSWRRSLNAVQPVEPIVAEHGNHIFIYRNVRTNQIVYSLTRSLNVRVASMALSLFEPLWLTIIQNHAALKQIPFLGKKTVPPVIRKDIWLPFALVEFPSSLQGLNIYRKLRELRRLHETSYDLSLISSKDGHRMPRKRRASTLMNQRANTVADLAAVLLQEEAGPLEGTKAHKERSKKYWDRIKGQKAAAGKPVPKKDPQEPAGIGGLDGVSIRWADMIDTEYAKKWPEKVEHGPLQRSRYTAAFPAYELEDPEAQEALVPEEAGESKPEQAQA